MAQSPLNGTIKPVDIEEVLHPIMHQQTWLKNKKEWAEDSIEHELRLRGTNF